jgi:hypothetical protein
MTARFGILREYRFTWPAVDAALLAGVLRGLMLLLIVVGVGWLVSGVVSRHAQPPIPELGNRKSGIGS